jgi:hypothetical protein
LLNKNKNKRRKKKMQFLKNKIVATILCMLMVTLIVASTATVHAQAAGSILVPTISFCNVAPNPCGVGQTVTVDFWLAVPLFSEQDAVNMTVYVTPPGGTQTSLGTFTSDTTGGTFTTYTPTEVGNYTFQLKYGGQQYAPPNQQYYNEPSVSALETLVVTSTPRGGLPNTPLPTAYWETPVNSENIQNWAALNGGWMGYGSVTFANTGGYNATGNYNPYSTAPASAHIIWTKPWCVGGAAGALLGNTEQYSSYWTTSQYDPKYAPVIMNGVLYSTWFTTQTGSSQGVIAVNLYNGQTEWVINTTTILRCGMILNFPTIDQYGCVGPYIFTQTGGGFLASGPSTWYMWDAMTGQYLAQIANVPTFAFLGQDANGNLIGYLAASNQTINPFGPSPPATDLTVTIPKVPPGGPAFPGAPIPTTKVVFPASKGPVLEFYNLTNAFIASGNVGAFGGLFDWTIPLNSYFDANNALVWAVSMDPTINGQLVQGLGTALGSTLWAGNTLVFEAGTVSVSETTGYLVEAGYSQTDGHLMWITNRTGGIYQPYTRLAFAAAANGIYVETNQNTFQMAAYSDATGEQVWTTNLNVKMADGNSLNTYDAYGLVTLADPLLNTMYVWGVGGDVWAVNMANGNIIWTWSTYQINGPAGTESPYGVYPIWVFADHAMAGTGTDTILYLSEGHEYNPPLLHGALELALNATDGKLVWSNLGFDDTGTEVTDGVLTTFNAYDGQVYAYAQGPSRTTISVPSVGVTTATPIVISGTVTDVSPGASQEVVKADFPNGLPCVSDDSMKGLMEAAYEQQPLPSNMTGVPVTLYVLDSNHNYRSIGTTTSDASGTYSLTWTPDISGNYTVYAVFAGTNGYWPSSAEGHIYASAPQATSAPTATPLSGIATQNTLMYGIIAIIIVIIIGIAVLAILMPRKRP